MSRDYADPDCPKCKGEGFLYPASMLTLPGEQGGRDCDCTLDYMRLANMEKIWPSLSKAREIPGLRDRPPLLGLTKKDLWITSKDATFRAHLKATCFRKHHMWDVKVWSDQELLKAWLNSAYAQGKKIYDSELDPVRVTAMYIDELVESYELVILMLGVKDAPNVRAPNVLLEAVKIRRHLGKPTWIVDQPDGAVNRIEHLCYSDVLEGILNHWPHVTLRGGNIKVVGGPQEPTSTVADVDPTELLEDDEAASEIDEALSDLVEAEAAEPAVEEDEEDSPAEPARSFLSDLAQNEKDKEQDSWRKGRPSKNSGKGRSK